MRLTPIRVYVDTSVFGGVFDEEFAAASAAFFERVQEGRFPVLISPLVIAELRDAPEVVRDQYDRLAPTLEVVEINQEVRTLQAAYLAANVVTQRWADDALHVALATVHDAELIVS
jgi:predicted nucleic acid-binding protein